MTRLELMVEFVSLGKFFFVIFRMLRYEVKRWMSIYSRSVQFVLLFLFIFLIGFILSER